MGTANQSAVPITFGSLFAGIGGMDLGLERAGLKCKWQVEINPYCQKVLEKHWPNVKRYGDITKIDGTELEPVDLICGGFPCQDVSCARSDERRGLDGARSGLWSEYLRLICHLRPRFVLIENVAALLIPVERYAEPPIATVLGNLAEIGFDAEWAVLRASQFGAHHHRQRVFILAYASGIGLEKELLHGRTTPEIDVRMLSSFRTVSDGQVVRPVPISGVYGVADGLSVPVEPYRGLGNAVYPDCAEWIGRRITEAINAGFQRAQTQ